jgi:hypothetical protein
MIWVAMAAVLLSVLVSGYLWQQLRVIQRRLDTAEERLAEFGPLMADTRSALRKAESRTMRADDLVSTATSLTNRADAASKFAYSVATNPVVRVLAFGRGLRRGISSLTTSKPTTNTIASSAAKPLTRGERKSAQKALSSGRTTNRTTNRTKKW